MADGTLIKDLTQTTSISDDDDMIIEDSTPTTKRVAVSDLAAKINKIWYATCSTASSTAAKVATTTEDGFTLTTGVAVAVRFTNINTASSLTLNVNSTGAKSMVYGGNTANASSVMTTYMWGYLDIVIFVYNGSNWTAVNKRTATTTLYGLTKLTDSTSSTSTTTAATPNSVKTAYDAAVAAQETADKLNSNLENIGTTYSNTATVTCSSGGVDSYTAGGSITLPAGTYVLVAKGIFASNTTVANRRVQIYDITNSASITIQSSYGANYMSLHCIYIVTITSDTTYTCRLSTGIGASLSGCTTAIQAVRIK